MTESAPTDDPGSGQPAGEQAPAGADGPPAAHEVKDHEVKDHHVTDHGEAFGEGADPRPAKTSPPPAPGVWSEPPAGLPPAPPAAGGLDPGHYPAEHRPHQYPTYPPAPYPGGPPPPGQAPPGYAPQGAGVSRPTNAMAIVSLVLGILGLTFVPVVASIPAAILGHIARKQVRERGEEGDGLALAGLILGWLGVAFLLLLVAFLVVALGIGMFATATGH